MTVPLSPPGGFENSLPRERATCHASRVERGNPSDICTTASTPIAAALLLKGISPGAALVFLLAGPATNITSLAVLLGTLGKRATAIYLATIALSSVLFGLAVGQIYGYLGFSAQAVVGQAGEIIPSWAQWMGALIILAISLSPILRNLRLRFAAGKKYPEYSLLKKRFPTWRLMTFPAPRAPEGVHRAG